ncbi:hypothetical protein ELQ90_03160 [Labedella phragmitis]|uniref:Uncharacterized protein n=1 Tax=Labedella phragmitis TaxID=2498849 RepID=A0A3S3ZBB1_9MICO|nr:hypothetical protein ELQ90_03160 [Labedella phragmitis]
MIDGDAVTGCPGLVVTAAGAPTASRFAFGEITENSNRPVPPSDVFTMSIDPEGVKEFVKRQETSLPGTAV